MDDFGDSEGGNIDLAQTLEFEPAQRKDEVATVLNNERLLDKFKQLYETSVDDLNQAQSSLQHRNAQIQALKQTIEEIKNEGERNSKLKDKAERLEKENKQLRQQLDQSQAEVEEHPVYTALLQIKQKMEQELQNERQDRRNALDGFQSEQGKNEQLRHSLFQSESKVTALEKELEMEIAQNTRLSEKNNSMNEQLTEQRAENVRVRIQLGSLENEMGRVHEIEKMRAQGWMDRVLTEHQWRQKVLIKQLKETTNELNQTVLQKLQLSKIIKAMEMDIVKRELFESVSYHHASPIYTDMGHPVMEHGQRRGGQRRSIEMGSTRQQRRAKHPASEVGNMIGGIASRKMHEITELDNEIEKLKREMNVNHPRHSSEFHLQMEEMDLDTAMPPYPHQMHLFGDIPSGQAHPFRHTGQSVIGDDFWGHQPSMMKTPEKTIPIGMQPQSVPKPKAAKAATLKSIPKTQPRTKKRRKPVALEQRPKWQ